MCHEVKTIDIARDLTIRSESTVKHPAVIHIRFLYTGSCRIHALLKIVRGSLEFSYGQGHGETPDLTESLNQ